MDIPLLLIFFGPWLVYVVCPVPDQIVEYRNYSMCAGFALLLALLFATAPPWLSALLVLAFSGLSMIRAEAYREPLAFWEAASRASSGDASRAYQELGAWTKANANTMEDLALAEIHLRKALVCNPLLGPALNNLGWVLIQKRWLAQDTAKEKRTIDREGLGYLQRCAEACPLYPIAWQDLGTIYEHQGRTDEAVRCFARALEIDPTMQVSRNRLGVQAFLGGEIGKALEHFDTLIGQNPSHWEYVYNRAVTLKHAGRKEEGQRLLGTIAQPFPVTGNMIPMEYAK